MLPGADPGSFSSTALSCRLEVESAGHGALASLLSPDGTLFCSVSLALPALRSWAAAGLVGQPAVELRDTKSLKVIQRVRSLSLAASRYVQQAALCNLIQLLLFRSGLAGLPGRALVQHCR